MVSLRVASLENQLTFYQQVLGFQLHWREGNNAGLGAGGFGDVGSVVGRAAATDAAAGCDSVKKSG